MVLIFPQVTIDKNWQIYVDMNCQQSFTQKDLKHFEKFFGGLLFLKHPAYVLTFIYHFKETFKRTC